MSLASLNMPRANAALALRKRQGSRQDLDRSRLDGHQNACSPLFNIGMSKAPRRPSQRDDLRRWAMRAVHRAPGIIPTSRISRQARGPSGSLLLQHQDDERPHRRPRRGDVSQPSDRPKGRTLQGPRHDRRRPAGGRGSARLEFRDYGQSQLACPDSRVLRCLHEGYRPGRGALTANASMQRKVSRL